MEQLRSSPARLTANATIKLPRAALLLMCLVYAVPGLLGRDPWKPEDASGFGVMWSMAGGHLSDWLMPNVAGAPILDAGPLMYWFGAMAIRIGRGLHFLPIDDPLAARAATLFMVLVAATSVWYATYLLGRRAPAQPLALAFGGQPLPRDYGRTLADGALLILLGTLGLAARAHESSPDIAAVAMVSIGLYGLVRGLDRPRTGAGWLALAVTGLALTRGPWPALSMLLVYVGLVIGHPDWRSNRAAAALIALPGCAFLLLLWPWCVMHFNATTGRSYLLAWAATWWQFADGPSWEALRREAKVLVWFALPAWPIALWGVWSWRRVWSTPHILAPGLVLLLMLGNLLITSLTPDWLLLLLLPSIVILAAFGLPTLKRGAANAVDWFSLLIYSLIALALWASWLTRMTSQPAGWALTLQRQVPGLDNDFHLSRLIGALCVSAGWIWLVHWRVVTHPKVLWRSVVLASGGVTLIWALSMTLWVDEVNYSRTYRTVALQLRAAIEKANLPLNSCIRADNLGLAQRASFAYFSGVDFTPVDVTGEPLQSCTLVLRQESARAPASALIDPRGKPYHLLWEGRRPSDRDERFRLFSETAVHAPAKSSASR